MLRIGLAGTFFDNFLLFSSPDSSSLDYSRSYSLMENIDVNLFTSEFDAVTSKLLDPFRLALDYRLTKLETDYYLVLIETWF